MWKLHKHILILVAVVAVAFGVTIPKLYKMCQIKGWLPGATARLETITQKWHQTADEHPRGRDSFWIGWSDVDIHEVGDHRVNVTEEYWSQVQIGSQVEVVRLPGDRWPYLRNGVFVSTGNFVFDGILLVLEIGVGTVMLRRLFGQRASRRQRLLPDR